VVACCNEESAMLSESAGKERIPNTVWIGMEECNEIH
jgi:hypothetical protein